MTTFHAVELNKNNKCNNKEFVIKRDVKKNNNNRKCYYICIIRRY